ncbi:MAG: hypothetical protein J0L93_10040 [Deltaproteobacteria bacterium]|nr:hypothetical protein [Deltaproteobacteria bacterium]
MSHFFKKFSFILGFLVAAEAMAQETKQEQPAESELKKSVKTFNEAAVHFTPHGGLIETKAGIMDTYSLFPPLKAEIVKVEENHQVVKKVFVRVGKRTIDGSQILAFDLNGGINNELGYQTGYPDHQSSVRDESGSYPYKVARVKLGDQKIWVLVKRISLGSIVEKNNKLFLENAEYEMLNRNEQERFIDDLLFKVLYKKPTEDEKLLMNSIRARDVAQYSLWAYQSVTPNFENAPLLEDYKPEDFMNMVKKARMNGVLGFQFVFRPPSSVSGSNQLQSADVKKVETPEVKADGESVRLLPQ